jgi:hypothetical protein
LAIGRAKRHEEHLSNAKEHIKNCEKDKALEELGISLHPYQDMGSHTAVRIFHTPAHHAPKWACLYYAIAGGSYQDFIWCWAQKIRNPNWDNPHRPDDPNFMPMHFEMTGKLTRGLLKNLYDEFPRLRCWCD